MPNGFYLYGDCAYPLEHDLIAPFKGANLSQDEKAFNKAMSGLRVSVQHTFGKIVRYFAFLDCKKIKSICFNLKAILFIVASLLTNYQTCLYGDVVSMRFDCPTPSLENDLL